MDSTRNLIDYAMDSNGVEFRNELYASIHDRVTAAIESKKQELAGSLIRQEAKEEGEEGAGHEKAEKKMMKSLDKNGDGKHSMADHQKEEAELDEMDKSQTPPGRDGGHRPGPEGEARPITPQQMVKSAVAALNKSGDKEKPKTPNAFTMKSKGPSDFAKSSSGGKTKETKTGRTHSSGDRY